MNLRLVTWNCAMALHTKIDRLMSLRPDIAVVPECAQPAIVAQKARHFEYSDSEWSGSNPNKGLGVFAFNGLTLKRHSSCVDAYRILLPVEVDGPVALNLLAVWAFDHSAPTKVRPNPRTTALALDHYTPFLQARTSLVAGDFNANVHWDASGKYERFADVNDKLQSLGLVSAYHHSAGAQHGQEPLKTLFFRRNTDHRYHIDYIYMPHDRTARIREMTVHSPDEWLSASDHVPLVLDVEL